MPDMGKRLVPPWLRRGTEAGVLGALLAGGTLAAFHLYVVIPRLFLPQGLAGALILAPAVVALGIFVVSYPAFLAATRSDAVMGAVAAFLIAADAFMAVSFLTRDEVLVHALGRSLPLGVVAAAASVPAAIAGLLIGQLTAPLGFGRSAGLRTAVAGAIAGLIAVIAVVYAI
jgi:Co/Zn/Cd efflux system component